MKLLFLFFIFIALTPPLLSYEILLPRTPEPTEKTAAAELLELLNKLPSKSLQKYKYHIFSDPSLAPEEWKIQKKGVDITISGGIPRGVLYGVYEFLEKYAGISFLDPWYTYIPKKSPVLPDTISQHGQPAVKWRGIYITSSSDVQKLRFYARNRENIFFETPLSENFINDYGIQPVFGQPASLHTFFHYTKTWDHSNTNVFSMDSNGTRIKPLSIYGPGQICFSSTIAKNKFVKQLKEYIISDRKRYGKNAPHLYNISVNNTPEKCECRACIKKARNGDSYAAALLYFINGIAREIQWDFPEATIQTSVSHSFRRPARIPASRSNTAICYVLKKDASLPFNPYLDLNAPENSSAMNDLKKWNKICKVHIWDTWITAGDEIDINAGVVNAEEIAEKIKFFNRYNSEYIFSECEKPELTSFHPLRVWIGYRTKNNPDEQPEYLMDFFFDRYYGDASNEMKKLYIYLKENQQKYINRNDHSFKNETFFDTAISFLTQAENAVLNDPDRLRHVKNERLILEISRLIHSETNIPADFLVNIRDIWSDQIHRYYNGAWNYKKSIRKMNLYIEYFQNRTAPGTKFNIPEVLQKEKIYEITSDKFSYQKHPDITRQNDLNAAAQKSISVCAGTKQYGLRIGVSSISNESNVNLCSLPIKKTAIPDEDYFHLYHIGKIKLSPDACLWVISPEHVLHSFAGMYNPDDNNLYDIFVSLKIKIAPKTETQILCDRILLIPDKTE